MSTNFNGPVVLLEANRAFGWGYNADGEPTRTNIVPINFDPAVTGLDRPPGSLALRDDVPNVNLYQKMGAGIFDWISVSSAVGTNAVAGAAITAGDLLRYNAAGQVIPADNTALGSTDVVGVSPANVLMGAAFVFASQGLLVMRFAAAPAAANNDDIVYLSTTGRATLTPPVAPGTTVYRVGVLQGANGLTTTPAVFFQPQFGAIVA